MNYETNERIKHLSERIKLFKAKRQIDRGNPQVEIQDLEFRLGDLLVELIFESQLQHASPSKSDLEEFHKKYKGNEQIDLDFLFKNYWIRNVLNRIEVPYSIKKACELITQGFPSEFEFIKLLNQFLSESNKEFFTNEDLKTVLLDYNKDKQEDTLDEVGLKDRGIYNSGLSSKGLELHPNAKYLLFIKKNEIYFKFIHDFISHFSIDGDAKYYSIDTKTANKVISKHKKSYPSCPSIKELIKDNFFNKYNNSYLFKLPYGKHADWWSSLKNLISGKLWVKLKNDSSYISDDERLDIWLDKIQINADYPSLCFDYMPPDFRIEFIKIIEKRILNETDISGCEGEIEKISLEQSYSHGRYPFVDKIQIVFSEDQSASEKYRLFARLDRDLHNLFHDQSCRNRIDLLLHIIIKTSDGFENPSISFPSIFMFLEASKNKPYLLWQVAELITYIRPEIIPYLFAKKGLQELGMLLLPTFELNQYSVQYGDREALLIQGEEFRSQINKEGLITLINSISHESSDVAAPVLVRAIIEIAKQIFYYPYNFDAVKQKKKQLQISSYVQAWDIISRFRIEKQQFVYQHGKDKPLFIFYLLKDFANEIIAYKNEEPFNEYYTPDIWRIDSLIRLLTIINNPALIQRKLYQETYQKEIEQLESQVINKIHQIYNDYFKIEKVDVRPGPLNEVVQKVIKFQSKVYGLDLPQWSVYLKSLNPLQRSIFFQKSFPQFDLTYLPIDGNRNFNLETENLIHKLRFHFKVMTNAYIAIIDDDIVDRDLISDLEKHMTQVFCTYSKTVKKENKVDVFDKQFDAYSGENLFVRLIEASNTFTTQLRRQILDSLVENDQFERILSSMNTLVSQGDKQYLLSQLTEEKLEVFLKNQTFYFDVENALVYSINNNELADYAEKIINYIESKSYKVSYNYEQRSLLFHVKLLLAYRKGNIELLRTIEPPEDGYDEYSKNRLTDKSRKKYYEILLIHNEGKFDEAINQIDQLAYERKEDPIVLTLKFALYIERAKRKSKEDMDKGRLLVKEALEIFNSSIKDCDEDLLNDSLKKDILLNKLECFQILEQNANFDFHFSQIRKTDKYTERFACVIVDNKIQREQLTEASFFIEELTNYHRQRSGQIPDFIEMLRNNLSSHREHIIHLKQAYKDILCLSESQRIKALPEVITKSNKDLGVFLLGELAKAIISLQQKIYALVKKGEKVSDLEEDKITDVLELILNSRLSAWQMQWSSQSRSGTTGKDTNQLARADLSLNDFNTRVIFEALRIYHDKTVTSLKGGIEHHVKKSFNETSTRELIYNTIYYQADQFDTSWPEFKRIINEMTFPDRFGRISDMEESADLSTSDLKIGFTKHENKVVCYYLFININPAIK